MIIYNGNRCTLSFTTATIGDYSMPLISLNVQIIIGHLHAVVVILNNRTVSFCVMY